MRLVLEPEAVGDFVRRPFDHLADELHLFLAQRREDAEEVLDVDDPETADLHVVADELRAATDDAAGGRPPHLDKGYYVEPTLFVNVDPDATIAQEEIFGPVLCVLKYDGDDDAVRIANNSMYGLSGAVTSASLERAEAVARRIRTGTVSVNGGLWFGPDSPFGGYRQSGTGREHGVEGFEEYLETKTLGLPVGA